MTFMDILTILSRWLHVTSAILAVGGAFFLRVILPMGTASLDPENREAVFLRCRRGFKMVVHSSILVLLLTGAYNAYRNWDWYSAKPGLTHGLFGMHGLLALAVFAISLWLLAGREPTRSHRGWMKINLLLMLLAVAAASSLKWVRDRTMADQAGPPVRVQR